MNPVRLLIVDDDAVDRKALIRALLRVSVPTEVQEVETAVEGLERVAAGRCDCVLLDHYLPGMNGLEVLAELRRRSATVPVVALTGQGDERLAVELMKAGAADYLAKHDLSPERLERSLRHALAVADLSMLRQRLLEREQQARREAEAENAAKDQFLAMLSHELRTPLNVILGWSRLLLDDTLDTAARSRAHESIERNASSLARHIDDLLDISRIVTGNLSLAPSPTRVTPIVAAAVESMRPSALAKSIELSCTHEGEDRLVMADPTRFNQIVMNLVSNAIKFTSEHGRVDVRVVFGPETVLLEVQDTGVGIAPGFLPHLFSRFRQADPSASRKHGGLGLGLSIVQQLVMLHGGQVAASSDGEGRGATFRVRLPYGVKDAQYLPEPAPAPGRRLDGIRVLIVDDEPDARDLAATLLEIDGAVVVTASSADDARTALGTRPIDVLVSDIWMPGEDGYSLIESVRQTERRRGRGRVPAVALTALARPVDRERAVDAGFDEYLAKPVQADILVGTVAALAPSAGGQSADGPRG